MYKQTRKTGIKDFNYKPSKIQTMISCAWNWMDVRIQLPIGPSVRKLTLRCGWLRPAFLAHSLPESFHVGSGCLVWITVPPLVGAPRSYSTSGFTRNYAYFLWLHIILSLKKNIFHVFAIVIEMWICKLTHLYIVLHLHGNLADTGTWMIHVCWDSEPESDTDACQGYTHQHLETTQHTRGESGKVRFGARSCSCTVWCSEIGSLMTLDAPDLHAASDVRGPISLHQAVLKCTWMQAQVHVQYTRSMCACARLCICVFTSLWCICASQSMCFTNGNQTLYLWVTRCEADQLCFPFELLWFSLLKTASSAWNSGKQSHCEDVALLWAENMEDT